MPERKPWEERARSVVLYRSSCDWRFAVYYDVDVADGVLSEVAGDADPVVAQAATLRRVESLTGTAYLATWRQHENAAWTAELNPGP